MARKTTEREITREPLPRPDGTEKKMENDSQAPLSVRQVRPGLEVPSDPAGVREKMVCFMKREKVTHPSSEGEQTFELDSFIAVGKHNTQVNVNSAFYRNENN